MMADQDQEVIIGNWRVIANMSIGKLLVTKGLNNGLVAQIQ